MQNVSDTYRSILQSLNHRYECTLAIGESGLLVDNAGDYIVFGSGANSVRLLVDSGGADSGFDETMLISIKMTQTLFAEDVPMVGCAVAAELDVEMIAPLTDVPRKARVVPYVRVTDGTRTSEWVQQGVFYVDTREKTHNSYGEATLKFHAYDAMVMTDVDFPSVSTHNFPCSDTQIVQDIADYLGFDVDQRTWNIMDAGYQYGIPVGFSCREVLQQIAASYCGNFIMSETGELRLVQINEMPRESSILCDNAGYGITWADHWDLTWNQLWNRTGWTTVTGTASSHEHDYYLADLDSPYSPIAPIQGHIYYVKCETRNLVNVDFTRVFHGNGAYICQMNEAGVSTATVVCTGAQYRIFRCASYTRNAQMSCDYRMLICDLTLAFGAGNEPTAEVFNQMFPNYYPYDEGTAQSYDGVVKIVV